MCVSYNDIRAHKECIRLPTVRYCATCWKWLLYNLVRIELFVFLLNFYTNVHDVLCNTGMTRER